MTAPPRIHETFESFWGNLLLVAFHEGNPRRWEARRERAHELADLLDIAPGADVLELGCGDGLLDICLAKRGAHVTAVDRLVGVLERARLEPGGEAVDFVVADLRDLQRPARSLDVALAFELIGLMSAEDEQDLFRRVHAWLRTGGRFLLDVPREPGDTEVRWERELEGGTLEMTATYDRARRLQHLRPRFRRTDGRIVDLVDPHDDTRQRHEGVLRRLPSPDELASALREAGFSVRVLPGAPDATHHRVFAEVPR